MGGLALRPLLAGHALGWIAHASKRGVLKPSLGRHRLLGKESRTRHHRPDRLADPQVSLGHLRRRQQSRLLTVALHPLELGALALGQEDVHVLAGEGGEDGLDGWACVVSGQDLVGNLSCLHENHRILHAFERLTASFGGQVLVDLLQLHELDRVLAVIRSKSTQNLLLTKIRLDVLRQKELLAEDLLADPDLALYLWELALEFVQRLERLFTGLLLCKADPRH